MSSKRLINDEAENSKNALQIKIDTNQPFNETVEGRKLKQNDTAEGSLVLNQTIKSSKNEVEYKDQDVQTSLKSKEEP